MTFLEELRMEAAKACRDKRHRELSAKRLCGPEPLDELREAMLAAAKKGEFSILAPIEGLAAPEWRPIYSKDYRSHEKARFDQELCEFLSLHFEGVRADSRDRWTIRLSWR
jgi:hypothetical protein